MILEVFQEKQFGGYMIVLGGTHCGGAAMVSLPGNWVCSGKSGEVSLVSVGPDPARMKLLADVVKMHQARRRKHMHFCIVTFLLLLCRNGKIIDFVMNVAGTYLAEKE
jgi:hypothetical protein